jgi:predicted MFS family arabinose efflux permease
MPPEDSATAIAASPPPAQPPSQQRVTDTQAGATGNASPAVGESVPGSGPRALAVALAGLLSLAVAMGIGRFAFTPLLPMMLNDGVISLPAASWLATANYVGYWLGAIACAVQPLLWARWRPGRLVTHTTAVRIGLVATVLLTAAMAQPWPLLWPLWRFLAGLASALVFVYLSGWCLARLSAMGHPSLAGLIFVGPGLGIAVSGLAATGMVAGGAQASTAWLAFALLAAVLTTLAWPRLQGPVATPANASASPEAGARRGTLLLFSLAYGLAGLGYIVTATFLPVIARQALPGGSVWPDLFWPMFGAAVAAGALITLRIPDWDRRKLLVACYALQALGVLLTVWWPTLAGFALGSLLLGLPFTAITLFAVQEARRLRPHNASALIGTLTASWGLGQIAGPPLVAWLLPRSANAGQGFERALLAATAALVLGALVFAWLLKRHPLPFKPAGR